MSKSTYHSSLVLNPHMSMTEDYPHKDMITFIVVTRYAPRSTYSPRMDQTIIEWSDRFIGKVLDDMMGVSEEEEEIFFEL